MEGFWTAFGCVVRQLPKQISGGYVYDTPTLYHLHEMMGPTEGGDGMRCSGTPHLGALCALAGGRRPGDYDARCLGFR